MLIGNPLLRQNCIRLTTTTKVNSNSFITMNTLPNNIALTYATSRTIDPRDIKFSSHKFTPKQRSARQRCSQSRITDIQEYAYMINRQVMHSQRHVMRGGADGSVVCNCDQRVFARYRIINTLARNTPSTGGFRYQCLLR